MKMGGDRRSRRIEAHADFILAQIEAQPDVTIMELREKIRERHNVGFGYGNGVAVPGATRDHAQEEDRPFCGAGKRRCCQGARGSWFEGQLDLDPSKLVFLDETAVSTNMAPRFGWSPRGERCRMSVPFGWKTKTLVAALRWDRIDAPMTIDGALDGASFLAYVEQVRPTLSAGETVLMDNVRTHKVAGVKEAIEAKGAHVVYLPSYSPDFNPIEKPFLRLRRSWSASRRGRPRRWRRQSERRCRASRRKSA